MLFLQIIIFYAWSCARIRIMFGGAQFLCRIFGCRWSWKRRKGCFLFHWGSSILRFIRYRGYLGVASGRDCWRACGDPSRWILSEDSSINSTALPIHSFSSQWDSSNWVPTREFPIFNSSPRVFFESKWYIFADFYWYPSQSWFFSTDSQRFLWMR